MHAQPGPAWIGPVVTAAIICLVLALRLSGLRRARRLRLETLWIVPALYLAALAAALWEYPPIGLQRWIGLLLALAVGGVIGWRRGGLMRITIDPASHSLNQQSSPAALLLLVLLIVARQGLRYEAAALGLNLAQVTGLALAFAFGLFGATRAEMFVRARRLLRAHRAAGE